MYSVLETQLSYFHWWAPSIFCSPCVFYHCGRNSSCCD